MLYAKYFRSYLTMPLCATVGSTIRPRLSRHMVSPCEITLLQRIPSFINKPTSDVRDDTGGPLAFLLDSDPLITDNSITILLIFQKIFYLAML